MHECNPGAYVRSLPLSYVGGSKLHKEALINTLKKYKKIFSEIDEVQIMRIKCKIFNVKSYLRV